MTPDEQNDLIHAQVDDEFPKPPGGFETDDEERDWREAREKRFLELCKWAK